MRNVFIIGMPGSGKTTLAKEFEKNFGVQFPSEANLRKDHKEELES